MSEFIIRGCELVCVLFTLMCVIAAFMASVAYLWGRIADARRRAADDPRPGWQFSADIQSLDRWCCWHFPIVEDICGWLMNKNGRNIDEFRADLIRKYGERNGLPLDAERGTHEG